MKLHNILHKAVVALLLPLGGVGGGLLCSCTDWSDHYEDNSVAGSNTTLWEEIQSRPELSDFAKVLENTKVFRMHRKTAASYSEVVNGGQSLTIFAPVNGTFDCNALIKQAETNAGDSAVEHFFVKNHVARTPFSAVDSKFRMLNDKRVTMTSTDVWGIPFVEKNIHTKNGILHIVQEELPYNKTIYEAFTLDEDFSLVGNALKKYTEDIFNQEASVQIGLVEGVPVYADSVVYENNKMINTVGLLNAEDSTYLVAVPTNKGWEKAWNVASSYFNFDPTIENRDSLTHYWTTRALLDDAIFSRTMQRGLQDSVQSKWFDKNTPEYHVFYKPFEADGLFGKAEGEYQCSNGVLYKYDEWPFTPSQTYFKKIELEAEQTWNMISYENVNYKTEHVVADTISRGAFVTISPIDSRDWTANYKIANTLSGKYDICVKLLPETVINPSATNSKPCKFRATLNYIGENGEPVSKLLGDAFTSDKLLAKTVVLAEDFYLPVSNYNQTNDKITITLQSNVGSRDKNYVRTMYLDCIVLMPKE